MEVIECNTEVAMETIACGSCNFENYQNITRAQKSRNALAFIRFPILIINSLCTSSRRRNLTENLLV